MKSRMQAPNVFFNLEASSLTQKQAVDALRRARNSVSRTASNGKIIKGWDDSNRFTGGTVILKLRGRNSLVYVDVNSLRTSGP